MNLPYLTQEFSGIGGEIKSVPADFYVEEIPRYLPGGEGQHLYITIEKTGVATLKAINMIARALGVHRKNIGYAGMKDAHAVTRQTLSIDGASVADVEKLDIPGIKIIAAKKHRNKLKLGHLAGNKFVIRIRGVDESVLPQAETVLSELEKTGVPNYFGEQRFGRRNNTHLLGLALLKNDLPEFLAELLGRPRANEALPAQNARAAFDAGDWQTALDTFPPMLRDERAVLRRLMKTNDPQKAIQALDKRLKRLYISAIQSHFFNRLLAQRLPTLTQIEWGDVAYLHQGGAAFVVTDVPETQPRVDAFEISPTGPLFGEKYLAAAGAVGERELALLREADLTLANFNVRGANLGGSRRPYRIPVTDVSLAWDEGVMLTFSLPAGAYATMLLRELMKN